MKKIKEEYQKNGYILRSFKEGEAEKYCMDCFQKVR